VTTSDAVGQGLKSCNGENRGRFFTTGGLQGLGRDHLVGEGGEDLEKNPRSRQNILGPKDEKRAERTASRGGTGGKKYIDWCAAGSGDISLNNKVTEASMRTAAPVGAKEVTVPWSKEEEMSLCTLRRTDALQTRDFTEGLVQKKKRKGTESVNN